MARVDDMRLLRSPPGHPMAETEIDGHQIEIGIDDLTREPIVIDWRTELAWRGSWAELIAGNPTELLEQVATTLGRPNPQEERRHEPPRI